MPGAFKFALGETSSVEQGERGAAKDDLKTGCENVKLFFREPSVPNNGLRTTDGGHRAFSLNSCFNFLLDCHVVIELTQKATLGRDDKAEEVTFEWRKKVMVAEWAVNKKNTISKIPK